MNNISELSLSDSIYKALKDMNFEQLTDIQELAIPILLEGKDLIGQSQTGTGKTAAFAIPLLEKVDPVVKSPQAIILCPTRELAVQVANEFNKIGKYMRNVKTVAVYGGEPIYRQITQLKRGAQIIIGTPGRTIDHINRGTIKLDDIHTMILDEADEMLKMGFREDIEQVLSNMDTANVQTVLFSATMPQSIIDITKHYQKDPELIKVKSKLITADTITQQYLEVKRSHKIEAISRILEVDKPSRCIVFCNTKSSVNDVCDALMLRNFPSDKIHGDLKQEMRMDVLKKFNNSQINVLVATDVAARGLDIQNVDVVINYDVPDKADYYVHRIGRSGRAGKEGRAITLVSTGDRRLLRDITSYTKTVIEKIAIPTNIEVNASKITDFIEELDEIIKGGDMHEYMTILNQIDTVHPLEEICAALIKKTLSLDENHHENDINFKVGDDTGRQRQSFGSNRDRGSRDQSARGDRGERGAGAPRNRKRDDKDMVRMFFNVGNKDNLKPKHILGAIAGECNVKGSQIGAIDMLDKFTFVDVHKDIAKIVLKKMEGNKINNKKVSVEIAKTSKDKSI
jgi:ATP-dependent RNA helicase DeaD